MSKGASSYKVSNQIISNQIKQCQIKQSFKDPDDLFQGQQMSVGEEKQGPAIYTSTPLQLLLSLQIQCIH